MCARALLKCLADNLDWPDMAPIIVPTHLEAGVEAELVRKTFSIDSLQLVLTCFSLGSHARADGARSPGVRSSPLCQQYVYDILSAPE